MHCEPNTATITPMGAQVFAARNLNLLATIEKTLDALSSDTELVQAIHAGYEEINERLQGIQTEIDPKGVILGNLEEASNTCVRIYRDTCERHQSACDDPLLRPDDGVADAYGQFIEALNALARASVALGTPLRFELGASAT